MDENTLDPRFETNYDELSIIPQRLKASVLPIVRDLAVKHTSVSDEGLRDVIKAQKKACSALEYSLSVLEARSIFRQKTSNFKIISLGFDCLPRTLATKYGLIEPRSAGRLTCPFDLCVHPLTAVISLLQNDFAGYQEREEYCLTDGGMPRHKKLNILFNHDLDPELAKDKFSPLMALYAKRAQNFREYAGRRDALFVANIRNKDTAHVPELISAISELYPHSRLVLIDTEGGLKNQGDIDIIRVCKPWESYRWFMVEDFSTSGGATFERSIINQLAHICFPSSSEKW